MNKTEHWQNLYNDFIQNNNFQKILQDKLVLGLFEYNLLRYLIPTKLRDDFFQVFSVSIYESFEKYSTKLCDSVLPYVLRGLQIAAFNFINHEMYIGSFNAKDSIKLSNFVPLSDNLEQTPGYDPDIDNSISDLQTWMKSFLTPIEYEVICYQWGLFDHEKLRSEDISKKLSLTEKEINKIKANFKVKSYCRIDKKNHKFIYDITRGRNKKSDANIYKKD